MEELPSTVWMRHPDLPDNPPVEQPRAAYTAGWRHRGWVETDPPADPADEADQITDAPALRPARKPQPAEGQKGKE